MKTREPKNILVGGGVRCGKSRHALSLAAQHGDSKAFIATAELLDDEMRVRAANHRLERGPEFENLEVPLALVEAVASVRADVVVVDCITLWLSNQLVRGLPAEDVLASVDRLVTQLARRERSVILVSNEVGMGIVPEHELGRVFRDVSGVAHQRLAAAADEVYLGAMGLLLKVKPSALLVEPGR